MSGRLLSTSRCRRPSKRSTISETCVQLTCHLSLLVSLSEFYELILSCRIHENSSLTAKRKGKKRKIAETSNVITETLPSVEGEQVSMFMVVTLREIHDLAKQWTKTLNEILVTGCIFLSLASPEWKCHKWVQIKM